MGGVCSSEDAVKVDDNQEARKTIETKTVFGTEKKTVELELGKITVIRTVFTAKCFKLLNFEYYTNELEEVKHHFEIFSKS